MAAKKRPEKPFPRFGVGDTIRAFDDPMTPCVVDEMVTEWVSGEWREYVSFTTPDGHGAGNADLFYRSKASPSSGKGGGT